MEFGNWTGPVMFKRIMFEYEQEVRAVWFFPPMKDGEIDLSLETKGIGKRLQVDLRVLIESMYLAPAVSHGSRSWSARSWTGTATSTFPFGRQLWVTNRMPQIGKPAERNENACNSRKGPWVGRWWIFTSPIRSTNLSKVFWRLRLLPL